MKVKTIMLFSILLLLLTGCGSIGETCDEEHGCESVSEEDHNSLREELADDIRPVEGEET